MKALIAYASRLGHTRAIAKALASELTRQGVAVVCVPARRVNIQDLARFNLLVLGTYTHSGRGSRRLHRLCEAIPHRWLDRMEVAVFGTQRAVTRDNGIPGGVDDLVAHLEDRGCEVALPPLRIGLRGAARFLPWLGIGGEERRAIKAFAADLLEVTTPAPLV